MSLLEGYGLPQGAAIGIPEVTPSFMPIRWLPEIIYERRGTFNLARYVDMMSFPNNQGKTIRMPRAGMLAVRRRIPGQAIQYQNRREGEWWMNVERETYVAFAVEDLVEIQANRSQRAMYTKEIGYVHGRDIERALLAERASFIGYDPVNNHIQSDSPISWPDILAAWNQLLLRDLGTNFRVSLHIGPYHMASMFNIPEFIESGTYNSGNIASIQNGTIVGTILGMEVVFNSEIRRNGPEQIRNGSKWDKGEPLLPSPGFTGSPYWPTQSGTEDDFFEYTPASLPANKHSAFMVVTGQQTSAIKMAVQKQPRLEQEWDMDLQLWKVASTSLYDIKVQDPELGIVISTNEEGL